MQSLEFPDFVITTSSDANRILQIIRDLDLYIFDINIRQVMPVATEQNLVLALFWIPFAVVQLYAGKRRFSDNNEVKAVIEEAIELLNVQRPEIELMLSDNERLREEARRQSA
ncbi:hypothetical protein F4804DRAFT_309393 [Jackrogersella minutella]|nr:hypothetical protein F4804DRAFT_309393 [Jackrogersella minutella]